MPINFFTNLFVRKPRRNSAPQDDPASEDPFVKDENLMDLLLQREIAYFKEHPLLAVEKNFPDLANFFLEIDCIKSLLQSDRSILVREKIIQNLILKLFQDLPFEDD